jgi:predicted dehydrogenase
MNSGALVQTHFDYVQFPQRRIFEVYGDRGTLAYDFMTGEIRFYAFGKEHRWENFGVAPIMERRDDLFRAQLTAFLENRSTRQVPQACGADGVAALRVAAAAIRAAQEKRTVAL